MEKSESSLLLIRKEDLLEYKEEITNFIKSVSWKADYKKNKTEIDLSFLINAGKAIDIGSEDSLSILKNAVNISKDRTILSNYTNQVLNAIRDGYTIAKYVADKYATASGLELLQQKNKDGSLFQTELPEFHNKQQTQSACLLFTAAKYFLHQTEQIASEQVDAIAIDFQGIPELSLSRPSQSIRCSLYYYAAYLERSGVVKNDLYLVKLSRLFFQNIIEEVLFRKGALQFTEAFENNHYKLEDSNFVLQGFEATDDNKLKNVSFNRIAMEAIVGNRKAKHYFSRYAERLLCYDFEAKKNPMNELGGLPSITMADGKPGTGKSMLIAATATLLNERCEQLGYNFLFWPLPENIVSTYQGGTAERAIEWFKPMQDSSKIIFAPIDDAENNLEERTRQGVSAGVREFIGVFLRNTEGAYAINYGNRLISLFTNIPDQIDKAVLSRIQMRTTMDGAVDSEDFIDQDYIWWKKYVDLDDKFIDASDPKEYSYMNHQQVQAANSKEIADAYPFKNEDLKLIFENSLKEKQFESHEFFGAFYKRVLQKYSFFSSRDLRNIQKAVDARIIDFDLPSLWWEKPDTFFFQNYDRKLAMLMDLVKENLKGATFSNIRLFEALNYIENAVRINETGINRRIKEQSEAMYIQQKANELLLKNKNI